jgi:hypothetical protein
LFREWYRRIVPSAENANQIARRGRYRSALCRFACPLNGADRNYDLVPFRRHGVGMGLIEIEHYARDERARAVLPCAYAQHSIHVNRNSFYRVVGPGIGEVEQNAIGIRRRVKRRLYGTAERNFHTQIRSLTSRGHALQGRRTRCALSCGTRQQEHPRPEMFLHCHHSLLTLAGASPAA